MHLIKKIFTIDLFSMSIYSQDYYGRMVDLGNVSEAGTDIIIYFEENTEALMCFVNILLLKLKNQVVAI